MPLSYHILKYIILPKKPAIPIKYFRLSVVYIHKEFFMKRIFNFLLGASVYLSMIALFSVAVMFLWNALLPGIFGLPVIHYWQSAGLLILMRILFGGIGGGTHMAFGYRNLFRDKWGSMSRAEREAFLQRYGHGFHHHEETETGHQAAE
jgi:hypothetical protein